ncbi:MAG TPA: hypothetical protein VET65_14350 [Candidatus Limnocylindrales bacterium]|nr:hypothetical protein [Candidatus Limnocylindrales bacterium]
MDASDQREAQTPDPADEQAVERRQRLEDDYEALLLAVMALEEEWLLDDRIAFSLRQKR